MRASDFLVKHGMEPKRISLDECASRFLNAMEAGLRGEENGLPMIPTYLKAEGTIPPEVPVAVIDAGGTNFRSALLTFTEEGYTVNALKKSLMPGVEKPASWDEFISFTADNLMPLMDKTDYVGFCFSYLAHMTPSCDGFDPQFTKQVKIEGGESRFVCGALKEELSRREIRNKKFVLLNDTAAVLLGVSSLQDKSRFDGLVGLVCGTGTNTCCIIRSSEISKLETEYQGNMLVNLESGYFKDLPRGDVDLLLDADSSDPGRGWLEKMTSGVYIGELIRRTLIMAKNEGVISANIESISHMDGSVADAWCDGENLDVICRSNEDKQFVKEISQAVFDRSARCVCANLAAIMLLNNSGNDRPVCICAEGSLYTKSRHFRPLLDKYMEEYVRDKLGRSFEFHLAEDTTLLGAAAAALLNN